MIHRGAAQPADEPVGDSQSRSTLTTPASPHHHQHHHHYHFPSSMLQTANANGAECNSLWPVKEQMLHLSTTL